MATVTGYSRPARALHWISAGLILVLLGSGFRAGFAEDAATKTAALRVHLPVAMAVLVLTLVRLVRWWRFDRKPPPLPGIPQWQERAAHWTHVAFYVLIGGLLASGIAMSVLSGLPDALFGAAPLPEFDTLPPRAGQGIGARVMVALVALHVGAALYHHLWLRDGTLRRIWGGRV